MKNFESYFSTLEGYTFATPKDRELALWAALWASVCRTTNDMAFHRFRPPLVIIEGPAGSGKTHLARALSNLAEARATMSSPVVENDFNMIAASSARFALFDDLPELSLKEQKLFSRFILAEEWRFRVLGTIWERVVKLHCLTVITSQKQDCLAEFLERSTVRIRLVERQAAEPVEAVKDAPRNPMDF